jgi:hypothetical protein
LQDKRREIMKTSALVKENARNFLEAYKGSPVAACVKHVSRTGMTRRIEFYAGYEKIGWAIAACLNLPWDEKGIRVTGCGFDPIYHVLDMFNDSVAEGFFNPEACRRL